MKKIFLIFTFLILNVLFSGNTYAGVNEPGVSSIKGHCAGAFKHNHKKHIEKSLKQIKEKKTNFVFYASCGDSGSYSYAHNKGKDLEKLHEKTYKKCMKNSKKYTGGKECYLYAVNEEIVWKYDQAKASAISKAKLAEAKVLQEKNAAMDKKPGRFFEDQPDVNDDYQIHFIYMLTASDKDNELDINGKIEEYAEKINTLVEKYSKKTKGSSGAKKYKYDYRKDGKLDVTFIRLDKKRKELHKHINNNYRGYLWLNGFNNPKKVYFTFADVTSVDGGEGGVGMASIFLKNKYNKKKSDMLRTAVHEMHHAMGGGYACVPGMNKKAHFSSGQDTPEKQMFFGKAYVHDVDGCPQGEDSVYLAPTSKDPYDPFKLICLNEWGKYNHKKLVELREKQISDLKKGKWNYRSGGSGCKFNYWDRAGTGAMKIFNNSEANRAYN